MDGVSDLDVAVPTYPRLMHRPTLTMQVSVPVSTAMAELTGLLRAQRLRVRVRRDGSVVAKNWFGLVMNTAQIALAPFAESFEAGRTSTITVRARPLSLTSCEVTVTVSDATISSTRTTTHRVLTAFVARLRGRGARVDVAEWARVR